MKISLRKFHRDLTVYLGSETVSNWTSEVIGPFPRNFRVKKKISESLPTNEQIPGDTEPQKFGETRYGDRVTMSERMIKFALLR